MSPLSVDRAPSRDRSAYLAMIPQLEDSLAGQARPRAHDAELVAS